MEAAKTLVQAFVHSRIDYCNSLLAGISQQSINKLQKVQNAAARVITRSSKRCHITPILKELHWLPVSARIKFKIICYAYQCLNGLAPSYLVDLVEPYTPGRSLRSGNQHLMNIPKSNLKNFGSKAFCTVAPTLWNELPRDLKCVPTYHIFKARLKTYLFEASYV